MLHNRGIRTKLLGVLALPILALTIITALFSYQAFDEARTASQVEKLAAGSGALGALVVSMQDERSVSVAFLNKAPVASELKKARAATDAALMRSNISFGSVDLTQLSPQALAAAGQAQAGHAMLKELRASVTGGWATPPNVFASYSAIIATDVALPRHIGDGLSDREFGRQATAFSVADTLVELATQEREVGLAMAAAGAADRVSGASMARLAALQTEAIATFRQNATASATKDLDAALSLPTEARAAYRDLQASVLAVGGSGRLSLNLDASDWRNATNSRIAALSTLSAPIASLAASQAADAATAARNRAILVLAGGALLVALLVLMGLVLSSRLIRPLRQLTGVAVKVREMLPEMVERMSTPGEGPGITMPEIPVSGNDEVSQLARVLVELNSTTLRVAEEQAALRASIAEMFVNVARRNHVLLSRQLSFIDQLERSEEDPDTLENLFRLDHLATRMRRNAESLIVLAGVDSGRRLRRPMPLSDVIRTAVSEIERYDRVDLALQVDPPMVGHVALSVAHLLAELLENATQFSNPDTRVTVSAASTAQGIRITVTDLGLGMTWDEIADANRRIANPPMSDVVGSQRLGFYVVGRLARRLDALVELRPGRAQGAIVAIDLPPALFVPGSVIEGIAVGHEPLVPSALTGPDDVADLRTDPADVRPTALAGAATVEPRVPVIPAPVQDPFAPVGDESAGGAPSSLLPRRGAREIRTEDPPNLLGTPMPATVPAPQPDAAPRTGIFGGFRALREATPPPAATGETALSTPRVDGAPNTYIPALDDSPSTFVPVLGPSLAASHHLPVRGDATLAGRAVVPQDPPAPTSPATASELGPLDEGWTSTALELQQEPAAPDVAPDLPVVAEPEVLPVRPSLDTFPQPAATPVVSAPDHSGWGARSALTDLAQDDLPVLAPAQRPSVDDEPAPRRAPLTAVASMDILPARGGGRGLRSRRHAKSTPMPLAPARSSYHEPPSAAPQPVAPPIPPSPEAVPVPVQPSSVAPSLFGSVFDAPPPEVSADPEPLRPSTFGSPPVPEPALPKLAAAQALRERSAMASQALSELSALSTYRPDAVQPAVAAGLVRRTPQATPAGQLPVPAKEPTGPRRPDRNAADVRSMLSGFQAGVERGRTSPGAARDEDGESR